MLKLKLHSFGHLMRRANSLEKPLMLGMIEGRRRRERQRTWLGGIINSVDMNLSKLWQLVKDMEAWCAAVHGFIDRQTGQSNWTTTNGIWVKTCSFPPWLPSLAERKLRFWVCEAKSMSFLFPSLWGQSYRASVGGRGREGQQDDTISYHPKQRFSSRQKQLRGLESLPLSSPQFLGWKFCPEGNRLRTLGPLMSSFQFTVEWNVFSGRSKKRPPDPLALPSFLLIK